MIRQIPYRLALLAVAALAAAQGWAQDEQQMRQIGRTTEKEIKVVLSSSFGSVLVSRGEPEKILVVESGDDTRPMTDLAYSVRNRVGYIDLSLGSRADENSAKRGGFHLGEFNRGSWHLKFSDAVPISFDVELGVGRGVFDFSGLQVKDFNLSTGASDVNISFDEPNRSTIENLNIESGVSKFEARNLGNANFRHLRFQGGVGAYVLDFSGAMNREVDVDLEVGLGVLTLVLPDKVGARVFYDKSWVSRLDVPSDIHTSSENEYVSDNYDGAEAKMNIRIDSGLGSVRIKRAH